MSVCVLLQLPDCLVQGPSELADVYLRVAAAAIPSVVHVRLDQPLHLLADLCVLLQLPDCLGQQQCLGGSLGWQLDGICLCVAAAARLFGPAAVSWRIFGVAAS